MKRSTAFLLLFSLVLFSSRVFSQINTIYPHLTISGFNDSWGGGFTEIRDDKRSVGLEVDYQFHTNWKNVMQTKMRYSVLTNRYNESDSSRLDELQFLVRHPIYNCKNWKLNLHAGGYLVGNLGGAELQNSVHDNVGVKPLDLPYLIKNQFYPSLGTSLWFDKPLSLFDSPSDFQFQAVYEIAPNYSQYFYTSIGLSLLNIGTGDFFSFSLAYQFTQVFLDEPTIRAVANTENGFSINFNTRVGFFNYGMKIYPINQFALGTIGISILSGDTRGNKRSYMDEVDAVVEFGGLINGGLYLRFSSYPSYYNEDNKLEPQGFELRYQFWTLPTNQANEDPNQLGHYQQITAGFNFNFFPIKPTFQLLPYNTWGLGYREERFYSANNKSNRTTDRFFVSTIEGGLRIKLPNFGIDNNCYYGLSINYLLTVIPGRDEDNFEGYFGIGGFVMVDF